MEKAGKHNNYHYNKRKQKDKKKDLDLEAIGFTVLRFTNWEVIHRRDDTAEIIGTWIDEYG